LGRWDKGGGGYINKYNECHKEVYALLNVLTHNPVAMRSLDRVCSQLIAELAGSNPSEGMDVRLSCLLCE